MGATNLNSFIKDCAYNILEPSKNKCEELLTMEAELKLRKAYRVRDVIEDLKKIGATPSVTYDVGANLVYFEYDRCQRARGPDDPVTENMKEFLDFLQHEYERQLLQGEIYKTADTPRAAFTRFAKGRPDEFLNYTFNRPPEYIYDVLTKAQKARQKEIEQYSKFEAAAKAETEAEPDDPDAWYKLRLLLWIIGKYKEASQAFQKAKSLGWEPDRTPVVAI